VLTPSHSARYKSKSKEKMDPLHLEIAQETALFGHSYDAGGSLKYTAGLYRTCQRGPLSGKYRIPFTTCTTSPYGISAGRNIRPKEKTQRISSSIRLISTTSMSPQNWRNRELSIPNCSRLSVKNLHMKPLRDRKKDIPLLRNISSGV